MLKVVFNNNLIALAINVCLCFVLFLPAATMWYLNVWWENMRPNEIAVNWVVIVIWTGVVVLWYFWFGRKFLVNTGNTLLNISSVIMLPIIISIAVLVGFRNLDNPILVDLMSMVLLLGIPMHPIIETAYFFLRIEFEYAFMAISILPSLVMWVGMISKRSPNF